MTTFHNTPWRAQCSRIFGEPSWLVISGDANVLAHGMTEEFARHVTNIHNRELLPRASGGEGRALG